MESFGMMLSPGPPLCMYVGGWVGVSVSVCVCRVFRDDVLQPDYVRGV
jgi:hypothetical protein